MSENLNLSEYQVVRNGMIAGDDEPQLTFNRGRIYINSYGLSLFPDEDYIRVLVNDENRSIVLYPFQSKKKDSFKWCGGNKRKPRHMRCMPLFYLVFRMMAWDLNARYRIAGYVEEEGEKRVLFFDLTEADCFQTTEETDENGKRIVRQCFPEDWLQSYGIPVMDYNSRQDIRIFDDEAVFDVEMQDIKKKVERIKANNEAGIANTQED